MMQARSRTAGLRQSYIDFGGGLNSADNPLSLPPGVCRVANNIECGLYGGYASHSGYERYSGQPSPSAATYSQISITLTGSISVGNTVTGVTSGATGYVIAVGSGFIAVTKVTGTFVSGEVLNVAAAPQATTTSGAVLSGASTNLLNAQYNNLAADVYRADIAAVPGSGNILGVVRHNDVTYAFRNNAGGTAADIYKSSAAGWANVPLYYELPFSQGSTNIPAEGSEISQSGGIITATVKRVALTSGSWDDGTAEGNLIITAPSGGDFASGYFDGDPTIAAANGVTWTKRITPSTNQWEGVAYGNGVFVAVSTSGSGNRAMYSSDGITWNIATTPSDNPWFSVAFGSGLFVAVGPSSDGLNSVMTSPDGITWTSRATPSVGSLNSVCYGNGLFAAVGTGGSNSIITSPDGITWTSRTDPEPGNAWRGVTYGGGLFVAVSSDGTNRVMTSPNGITWTPRTAAAANEWFGIAYDQDNGLFAAVASTGTNRVMTSPDGITWTSRSAATSNAWRVITWANGLFMAVAQTGSTSSVMTSPDGITWTARTAHAGSWRAATSGAGLFVVVGPTSGGYGVMTSQSINTRIGVLADQQASITLAPNGKYSFFVGNLAGSAGTKRIYGADGVSRGFEFDGDILVPIHTGMVIDTPKHVTVHKNHLFFTFDSSVQHSSIGLPYEWSAITGAAELAMGDTVTGFQVQPGGQTSGALAIFTRNRMSILYGSSSADWNLVQYREEIGAIAYTTQDVGYTIFFDDQGIMSLQTVQEFGNFSHSALSNQIKPFLTGKRGLVSMSCISRDKGQYRLYFTDGTGVYVTTGKGKYGPVVIGMTTVTIPNPITSIHSSEDSSGAEAIFFGSSNGFVYQMEKGTSFDGAAIGWSFKLSKDVLKSPRTEKRFMTAALNFSTAGYATFDVDYALGAESALVPQPSPTSVSVDILPGAKRDVESIIHLVGQAESISLQFSGNTDYSNPVTFGGAVINYAPRKLMR